MQNLVHFGYEGESYYLDENGYAVHMTEEEKTAIGFPTYDFKAGMNQLLPYYQHPDEQAKNIVTEPPTSEIRIMEAAVLEDNQKYAVPNYGASYSSPSYTQLGTTLDTIIQDARVAYIMGEIDDVGFHEAKEQWLRAGGQVVIDEMNELYHSSGN